MRKYKSREQGVLLKPAASLVASAHLDDLKWNPLQTSQLHQFGAELTHLCDLTTPRAVRSTKYHFFLLLLLICPQNGERVLNLHKYESCFLTTKIFFHSPSYTHTHTHTRSCIFTYLIHYHFLGNSRIDRPQGIILCPRSSSASIEGTSGTEERRPKAIKVPDHRVKTHRDSRPPKNCPLDPVFPP